MKREYRLRRSADFRAVRAKGVGSADGRLLLQARRNDQSHPRVGIAVGRRTGKAVERNHLRRQLRSLAAERLDRIGARDLVVVARTGAAGADFQGLARSFDRNLGRVLSR